MTAFALEEGVYFDIEDMEEFDTPAGFELTIRGIIHRKAFAGNVSYFVLEWDEQLAELFGQDNILEFKIKPLYPKDE